RPCRRVTYSLEDVCPGGFIAAAQLGGRRATNSYPPHRHSCLRTQRLPRVLSHRNDLPCACIPKNERQCIENSRQLHACDISKQMLIVIVALDQAVVRNIRG